MSDNLEELLSSYGLQRLVGICKENLFTVPAILALEEADINALTEYKGERVLLRTLIREKSKVNTPTVSSEVPRPSIAVESLSPPAASTSKSSHIASASSTLSLPSTSTSGVGPAVRTPANATSSGPTVSGSQGKGRKRSSTPSTSAAKKLRNFEIADKIRDLDIALLLSQDCTGGKELWRNWTEWRDGYESGTIEKEPELSESQRQKIAVIIATYLLSLSECPDHNLLRDIRTKLKELFPGEDGYAFYTAPYEEGAEQYHPKGKIPDYIRNVKHRNKNRAQMSVCMPSSSTSAAVTTPILNLQTISKQPITEEARAAGRWLATGRTPWPEVVSKWRLTAPLRYSRLLGGGDEHVNPYLNEWPILQHRAGHELILEDFKILYSAAHSKLQEGWTSFVQKTLDLVEKDAKNPDARALLATARSSTLHEDCLALAILQLLPYIRPNHSYTKKDETRAKASILEATNSFLLIVEKEAGILKALKDRRDQLNCSEGGGHPLIIIVGDLQKVTSAHVSIATLRYRVDSVVEALDLFFKAFHAFHIPYPGGSSHIWVTLQRGVYGFKTKGDYDAGIRPSWIKAYTN